MPTFAPKYTLLAEDGEMSSDPKYRRIWKASTLSALQVLYHLSLHITVFILLFLLWHAEHRTLPTPSLLASELSSAAEAVEYETTYFNPSGFSPVKLPLTPYEGPPSPSSNSAWHDLYDVGMYVLNSSAYTSLGLQTAELIDQPGNYLITLEVFHQLHCLDYIRLAAYASHNHKHTHHEGESEWSKEKHLSHCVDYLRQVLMCHGDLTPISLVRRDGVAKGEPPYRPDFSIRHTCRRWEKIWEFAERGNTSGFGVA